MKEARNFIFNNISSEDMGVSIVSVSSGLYSEQFFPNRNLVETSVANNPKPYFQRVEETPISFSLEIFLEDWQCRDSVRQVSRWLFQDYYKPLVFDTNLNRVYFAIVDGSSEITHNGNKEGYITIDFRCDSPYAYSYYKTTKGKTSEDREIYLYNMGDFDIEPILKLKKIGDGDISIINTETNQEVSIDNLQDEEEVYIDFRKEEIVSSLEYLGVYHYDNHNDEWLVITTKETGNKIVLEGDFVYEFVHREIYVNGWE